MDATQLSEFDSIFERVQSLPGPAQLSLASRILQSLEAANAATLMPIEGLLGLLAVSDQPPSDAQCAAIIAEERLRK